jgi:acyl-CoA hydrolase
MEVGVKVWAEHTQTGVIAHVASAYLVFVAIDDKGKPVQIPELISETPDQLRRYTDALIRREHRERESARRKLEALETRSLDESARGSE